jgi:ABC-type multidrug transport system permease subunit
MRRALAIAEADSKSMIREKMVVFWAIVWPALLVALVAFTFIPPEVGSGLTFVIGITNYDKGYNSISLGATLVDVLRNFTDFKVVLYNSSEDLLADLEKARLDIGVVIPENFTIETLSGTGKLYVYISGSDPQRIQINRGFAQGFFYQFAREVALEKAKVYTKYFIMYSGNYTNMVIPGLNMSMVDVVNRSLVGLANPMDIVFEEKAPKALSDRPAMIGWCTIGAIGMVMLYSGISAGAMAVVVERESGRLDRMIASGVKAFDLLVGKTISEGLILAISSIIVILMGWALNARIIWSPLNPRDWLVPLNLLLAYLMSMSIGFILSLATRSSRSAGTLGTAIGLLLTFTTGVWMPKSFLSQPIRAFADVFPVTWALDMVRMIMIYNVDTANLILTQIRVLAATTALIVVGIVAYRKTISRYVEVA